LATAATIAAYCAVALGLASAAVAVRMDRLAPAEEGWLPRYDLRDARRQVIRLPAALAEVSGLAFDSRGRLLAHNDETATTYVLDPGNGAVLHRVTAGIRGDFEGVAVAGERIFLVTSAGVLLEYIQPAGRGGATYRQVPTGLDRVCEVEGLAFDPSTAALLLPCKTPLDRKLKGRLRVYAVPLATLALDPRPRLDLAQSELKLGVLRKEFHPSAIERHPRSGSFFLLSGQESVIVEVSGDGRLLATRQLARKSHPQPEGLTFGPDLSLWIADESGQKGGTLTRYALTPTARAEDD
jgi:uncharacterized protein YjiK